MIMLMGYDIDAWLDMARLYVHEKNDKPKDLYELMKFWSGYSKSSPIDCLKIGMKLTACHNIDVEFTRDMICNFLKHPLS